MSDDSQSRMASFLYDHPRLMGALFTIVVLLSQTGTVLAGESGTISGP